MLGNVHGIIKTYHCVWKNAYRYLEDVALILKISVSRASKSKTRLRSVNCVNKNDDG